MRTGIFDVPFFQDEIGDDPRSPTVCWIAVIGRFLSNDFLELLTFVFAEFAWSTRLRFSCQSMQTVFVDFFPPSLDGGERDFENVYDFVVVEAAQDEIAGRQTPPGLFR